MTDHKTDHTDGGDKYSDPEMIFKNGVQQDPANPVSHTMGEKIGMELNYHVHPENFEGAEFTVEGRDRLGDILFEGDEHRLEGGDNKISDVTDQNLTNTIGSESLDATISVARNSRHLFSFVTAKTKVYRLVDAPAGGRVPTEWRIARVTSICEGLSELAPSIKKLQAETSHFGVKSRPDPWKKYKGGGALGECVDHVHAILAGIDMLGFRSHGAQARYVFPRNDMSAYSSGNPKGWQTVNGRQVGYRDSQGHFNNYEACVLYNGVFYLGGTPDETKTNAKEVIDRFATHIYYKTFGRLTLGPEWER